MHEYRFLYLMTQGASRTLKDTLKTITKTFELFKDVFHITHHFWVDFEEIAHKPVNGQSSGSVYIYCVHQDPRKYKFAEVQTASFNR